MRLPASATRLTSRVCPGSKRSAVPADAFTKHQQNYLDEGGQRDNAAYGWVRAEA